MNGTKPQSMNTRNNPTPSRSQRVIGNSLALIMAQVGTMVIGIITLPLLVPMVGPIGYGAWVIISGLLGYFAVFDFGLGGTFVAQLARRLDDREALRQIITVGVMAYGIMGVILFPVAWVVVLHLPGWFRVPRSLGTQVVPVFWLVYSASFFNLASNGIGALISALQWMRWQATLRVLSQLVNYSIVLIALLFFHAGLYAFAWGLWTASALITVSSLWKIRPILEGRIFAAPWRIPRSLLKSLVSYSGWLQINNVANQIIYETDRILTGLYVGLTWVTIYQINYKLGNTVRRIPLSLMGALLPEISRTPEGPALRQAYIDASRYLGFLTFFMGGTLMAVLPLLIKGWMGHTYRHESLVFLLLMVSYTSSNLTGIGTTLLRGQLRPQLTSYYTALTAFIKLIFSLILAPHYGLLGILVASVIGSLIGSLYFLSRLFGRLELTWWEGLGKWLSSLALAIIPVAWVGYLWAHHLASTSGRLDSLLMSVAVLMVTVGVVFFALRLLRFFKPQDWSRVAPIVPKVLQSPVSLLLGVRSSNSFRRSS